MNLRPLLLIFAIIVTLIMAHAEAVEVVLTCDPPTAYVNGDPLPPEHILGYTFYASRLEGGGEQTVENCTVTFDVPPGQNCFFAKTNATNGLSSNFAMVCKDVPGDGQPGEPFYVCP